MENVPVDFGSSKERSVKFFECYWLCVIVHGLMAIVLFVLYWNIYFYITYNFKTIINIAKRKENNKNQLKKDKENILSKVPFLLTKHHKQIIQYVFSLSHTT